MIRPLRQRHRRTMLVLAVVLPVLFVAALLVRPPSAVMEQLPAVLQDDAAAFPVVLEGQAVRWGAHRIRTELRADRQPATRLAVLLHPEDDLARPDLLVYWHPAATDADAGGLPAQSFLVGALAGRHPQQMVLPAAALRTDGMLVLYSLAHQAVVDQAALSTATPAAANGE